MIILLKGLTPIPYKLVTITSGFAGYNILLFILCSIVARGGRFFVVAILLNRYGDWIRVRIERHLGLWVTLGAVVLVLGFVIRDQADLDRHDFPRDKRGTRLRGDHALLSTRAWRFAAAPASATVAAMMVRSGNPALRLRDADFSSRC